MLVRVRFSETDPGQVTGYSVTLPDHTRNDERARLSHSLDCDRDRRFDVVPCESSGGRNANTLVRAAKRGIRVVAHSPLFSHAHARRGRT